MNPDADYTRLTASQARELADRAHQPQKICEDHFYHRIKVFVQQQASMGHYRCIYTIPGFTLGLPLYNVAEMASNLEKRLRKEGWTVRASRDMVLEISWGATPKTVLKSLDGLRSHRGR